MTVDPDMCARCRNQFPAGQVCDGCKAAGVKRRALVWLGQLATSTAGTMLGLWIGHMAGLWPA